jgi:hypothetical protein
LLVAAVLLAVPANAAADPQYSVMNAPEGVFWRSEPNWNAAERISGFGVYNGTIIEVHCYQSGTSVEGSADTMWEQATDIGGPGYGSGWLNEHFINDGQPFNQASPGVPPCSGAAPLPPPASAPPGSGSTGTNPGSTSAGSSLYVNANFNRDGAVSWALMHAKDPQPRLAMCAWFVSHALWAGGLPQVPGVWTDQGHYTRTATGTAAEWLVPNLKTYLTTNFSSTYTNITPNLKSNAVPQAEDGDLIFYAWEKHPGEGISHVAIVVGTAPGDYPEVAEMGQFDFGIRDSIGNLFNHVNSPYQKRGWTWSQMDHEWLQWKYPHVKAYLLHFNGGSQGDLG